MIPAFKMMLRNLPSVAIQRVHGWATSVNVFGEDRLDSTYIVGESSRGLGVVGRSHYVTKGGSVTERLPLFETWISDYSLPFEVTPNTLTPLGLDSSSDEVMKWLTDKFGKLIVRNINSNILVKGHKIPDTTRLSIMGCRGVRPDEVKAMLSKVASDMTKEEMETNNEFTIRSALWFAYASPLYPYNGGATQKPDNVAKAFLSVAQTLGQLTQKEGGNSNE